MEMSILSFEQLKEQIMQDEENQFYTKQGIEPLFWIPETAKILIIGQAPGLKAQESRKFFWDKSGDRLREWLGVDESLFYDSGLFAVVPMDFYYPGKGKSGDKPPRKGFAPKWHPLVLPLLKQVECILLVGSYAQNYYLKDTKKENLTETVRSFREYLPKYFPIVHPSPLNIRWMKKNPWFEEEVLPELKMIVNNFIKKENE